MGALFIYPDEIREKVLNLQDKFLELFNDFLMTNLENDFSKAYYNLEKLNKNSDFNNDHYKILLFTLALLDEPSSGSHLRKILISEGLMTESPYGKLVATIEENNNKLVSNIKTSGSKASTFYLDPSAKNIIISLGRKANLANEGAIIRISSYQPLPKNPNPFCFDFDFSEYFKEGKPLEKEWKDILREVKLFRREFRTSLTNLTIQPYSPHQCVGFLLGHVLGGFTTKIHQKNYYKEKLSEYWYYTPTRDLLDIGSHWKIEKSSHFTDSTQFDISEIALIINISSVISSLVKKFLFEKHPSLPFIDFHIADGVGDSCLRDKDDASIKIDALVSFLNDLMKEYPLTNLHIFWRAPFSFAVMLGQKLRTKWSCHVYEREGLTYNFYFAVKLEHQQNLD